MKNQPIIGRISCEEIPTCQSGRCGESPHMPHDVTKKKKKNGILVYTSNDDTKIYAS